jgi:YHS domain-containing protein
MLGWPGSDKKAARMFRVIIYALLSFLAFSFLRSIMGVLTKGISDAVRDSTNTATQPRQPVPGNFGCDLVKDPVCGTFVSVQSPFSKSTDGKTHHFCSQACLDRFAV